MSNYDENSESQKYWNEEGGNKWADNIDVVEGMIMSLHDMLIEQIAATESESVLDIGCGGGITSIKLAEQVGPAGSVLGVDVSEPILAVANSRAKGISNLDFQHSDAATAELGEDRFDIITSRFGVMFFDDPVIAFANLHTALKPSGRMVFICWRSLEDNPWMSEPAKAAFEILPPPADAEKPDPKAPGPFSLADPDHLQSILSSAGFNNIELQAMDKAISMGNLDDTIAFLMKMGPAAEVLKEANEEQKQTVGKAMKEIMSKYISDKDVKVPSATWIVSASK